MRLRILLFIAGVLAFSNTFGAGPGNTNITEDVLEKCSYESQAGIRDCLMENVQDSANALILAEKNLASKIKKWNEQPKFIKTAVEQFAISNNAYLKYRDAHCAFSYALGGGAIGNALEIRRLACVFGLNMERAKELGRIASTLPRK